MDQQLLTIENKITQLFQHFKEKIVFDLSTQLGKTLEKVSDESITRKLSVIAKSYLDFFHAYLSASSKAIDILNEISLDIKKIDQHIVTYRNAVEDLAQFNKNVLRALGFSFIDSEMPVLKETHFLDFDSDFNLIKKLEGLKNQLQNSNSYDQDLLKMQKSLKPEICTHSYFDISTSPIYFDQPLNAQLSESDINVFLQQNLNNSTISQNNTISSTFESPAAFVDDYFMSEFIPNDSELLFDKKSIRITPIQDSCENFDDFNKTDKSNALCLTRTTSLSDFPKLNLDHNCKVKQQVNRSTFSSTSKVKQRLAENFKSFYLEKMFGHIDCNVNDYLSTARYCSSVRSYGRKKKGSRKQMYNALHYEKVIRVDRIAKRFNPTDKPEKKASLVRSLLEILYYNLTKLGRVSMLPRKYSKKHEQTRNSDSFKKGKEETEYIPHFMDNQILKTTPLCTMVLALDAKQDDSAFLQLLVENMLQPFTFEEISEELQAANATIILKNAKKAFFSKKKYIQTASRKALTAILKIEKNETLVAEIRTALKQLPEGESESDSDSISTDTSFELQKEKVFSHPPHISVGEEIYYSQPQEISMLESNDKMLNPIQVQQSNVLKLLDCENLFNLDPTSLDDESSSLFSTSTTESVSDSHSIIGNNVSNIFLNQEIFSSVDLNSLTPDAKDKVINLNQGYFEKVSNQNTDEFEFLKYFSDTE